MSQHYSNPARESDPYALPDVEVFFLAADEQAELPTYEDEWNELLKRPALRLATMNSRDHAKLVDVLVSECGITGGWFWQPCFPGCLPDGDPIGPFETRDEAIKDAQSASEDI